MVPPAVEDLESIAQYIAEDSAAYAAAVVKTILNTASNFSRFPFSGRVVPELGEESIREWFADSYRVIYRVENEIVTVAAIVHGKRLLELE